MYGNVGVPRDAHEKLILLSGALGLPQGKTVVYLLEEYLKNHPEQKKLLEALKDNRKMLKGRRNL